MTIKQIKIKNFKSFKEDEIKLDKFNVLIGANASGKSNFVQILKFIKDLSEYGVENAISMQGGVDYTLNMGIGRSHALEIEITSDVEIIWPAHIVTKQRNTAQVVKKIIYRWDLDFSESKTNYHINEDKIIYKCDIYNVERGKLDRSSLNENTKIGIMDFIYEKKGEIISLSLKGERGSVREIRKRYDTKRINEFFRQVKSPPKEVQIQAQDTFLMPDYAIQQIRGIVIYDFDPKLSKKPQIVTGKIELEEDGSNLATVLNNILKSGNRRQFYNIITLNLPFVEGIAPKRVANSMLLQLREKYYQHKLIPGFLMSDGTINLTALVVALYFQNKSLKIIEEPERNLHPYLLSRVVDMMKEVAESEQIITTSHNPEVVRYSNPKDLLLATRSDEGYTKIRRPTDVGAINTFLTSEMGMSELYVQNMLEAFTR